MQFKNCTHCVHKNCLEDQFRLNKNECAKCGKIILDGYDKAKNQKRIKPNRVTKKKKELEENKLQII